MDECKPLVSGYTTATVAADAINDVKAVASAVKVAADKLAAIVPKVTLETAAGVKAGGGNAHNHGVQGELSV